MGATGRSLRKMSVTGLRVQSPGMSSPPPPPPPTAAAAPGERLG